MRETRKIAMKPSAMRKRPEEIVSIPHQPTLQKRLPIMWLRQVPKPTHMPARAPALFARFSQMPVTSARKKDAAAIDKAPAP